MIPEMTASKNASPLYPVFCMYRYVLTHTGINQFSKRYKGASFKSLVFNTPPPPKCREMPFRIKICPERRYLGLVGGITERKLKLARHSVLAEEGKRKLMMMS